jgi:membrane-associated protein
MAILFAECGLLAGLSLPGDSLLFTAGLLAAGGLVAPLWLLLLLLPLAAVAGNPVGSCIGRSAGPAGGVTSVVSSCG